MFPVDIIKLMSYRVQWGFKNNATIVAYFHNCITTYCYLVHFSGYWTCKLMEKIL